MLIMDNYLCFLIYPKEERDWKSEGWVGRKAAGFIYGLGKSFLLYFSSVCNIFIGPQTQLFILMKWNARASFQTKSIAIEILLSAQVFFASFDSLLGLPSNLKKLLGEFVCVLGALTQGIWGCFPEKSALGWLSSRLNPSSCAAFLSPSTVEWQACCFHSPQHWELPPCLKWHCIVNS